MGEKGAATEQRKEGCDKHEVCLKCHVYDAKMQSAVEFLPMGKGR